MKNIAVIGAAGFIGRNLMLFLEDASEHKVLPVFRDTELNSFFSENSVHVIVHLAGVNRPNSNEEFADNAEYLKEVMAAAARAKQTPFVVLGSSTQAALNNDYGRSKRDAERVIEKYCEAGGRGVALRMPNIFGKFARPNYNSVVATFCSQLVAEQNLTVHDPDAKLKLCYVDDLCEFIVKLVESEPPEGSFEKIELENCYDTTVGEVAEFLTRLAASYRHHRGELAGSSLIEKLRSTLSAYYPENYSIPLQIHEDQRGQFFEVMRSDVGQFSVLSSKPGVVRGVHYHHSKFESFLVLQGVAEFTTIRADGARVTDRVKAEERRLIMTQPGLVHEIENVGKNELIVWVWANENFDPSKPDTYMKTGART